MPRSVRQEYAGAVYHVMCRGNNGQPIFKEDKGCRLFLSTLDDVCLQTGWRVHAYVLMENHYHLLLETPEANLVAGMKWFQGTYTQRFNAMFQCRGHLFQGRYKALPVQAGGEDSYFLAIANYIHLNPFRSGIAGVKDGTRLESYRWSSYPAYIGSVRTFPAWLERERILHACGFRGTGSERAYKDLIHRFLREEGNTNPAGSQIENQLCRGWFIGGDDFGCWLANRLPSKTDNLRGPQRQSHDEAEAERLLQSAMATLGLADGDLFNLPNTAIEKQAVAWLLKRHTTVEVTWIARRLGMGHRTTVSRAISRFERAQDARCKKMKKTMHRITG